jgi:DNA-binding NarL/FixJ family response regulator
MRVILVGRPAARARLQQSAAAAGIEIVAEYATVAAARASTVDADALLVAPDPSLDTEADHDTLAEPLTPRELQVVTLLVEGFSNKTIADRLHISDQTVKFHVASICGKLGAANRTEVVRVAIRRGLVTI